MFITFEGIDGCGKSTHLRLLAEYIEKQGKKVVKLREPGGTDLSEDIRKLLLYGKKDINPISELLLFEAARANLVEKVIKPALAEGSFVLCDRFYDSTVAYQGYGRGLNLDDINLCNRIATQSLKPHLTFYLEIPLDHVNKRIQRKNLDRMEREGEEFFEKVIFGFQQIAELEPERFIKINSLGSIEHTRKKILKYFNERIGSKLSR